MRNQRQVRDIVALGRFSHGATLGRLKETDRTSQIVVHGKAVEAMEAAEYMAKRYMLMDAVMESFDRLSHAAQKLDKTLESCDLTPIGGTHLFRFVQCKDAHVTFEKLARQGIYVRHFAWSDTQLRIGLPAGESSECRLKNALSL